MADLIEGSWVLISVSAFSVLCYHMSRGLWKTSLYTREQMIVKETNISVLWWKHLGEDRTLRTAFLDAEIQSKSAGGPVLGGAVH